MTNFWTVYGCIGEFNEGFSLGTFDDYDKAEEIVVKFIKNTSFNRCKDKWYVIRDDRIHSKYIIFIEKHALNESKMPSRFNS